MHMTVRYTTEFSSCKNEENVFSYRTHSTPFIRILVTLDKFSYFQYCKQQLLSPHEEGTVKYWELHHQ